MTVRKIYEIALRVLGVLFLARAVHSFGSLVGLTSFTLLQPNVEYVAYAMVLNISSLVMFLLVGSMLLFRASRWADRLSSSEGDTSLQISLQSVDVLHIGMALVGASILVAGLASGLGELFRSLVIERTFSYGTPLLHAVRWEALIAAVVSIIAGFALLRYGSFQRRVSAVAGFLEETRGDSRDPDEPSAT